MSTRPEDSHLSELRNLERKRLGALPRFHERPDEERGVLLSDRITHYCEKYQLITPFEQKFLRPAGYDLRVGRNYSICDERRALNDGMKLEIGPYQVAIIETYETINMPEFLIGRWNIRVGLAYKGLLWVGGAQVDPGFRGHLCCPIYNLSTERVTLTFCDKLAMIDFVTTTRFHEGHCEEFPWSKREMLIFPDYPLLGSGIEAEVDKFKETIELEKQETAKKLADTANYSAKEFRDVQTRIDTFLTLVFTVVAVLFAGLGIVATKGSDEPSFISSPVWVAAVALYFALRSYLHARQNLGDADVGHNRAPESRKWWYILLHPVLLELTVAAIIVAGSISFHAWHAHVSAKEVQQARDQASKASKALSDQKGTFDMEISHLRQQADERIANLQQQINQLRQNQTQRK